VGNRLAHQSSAELVEAALRRPEFPKYIGIELGRRRPNEAGARRVCEAYREGRFEAWVAAFLLGNLQHRGTGSLAYRATPPCPLVRSVSFRRRSASSTKQRTGMKNGTSSTDVLQRLQSKLESLRAPPVREGPVE
jgi:hypothetical protein